VKFIGIKNIIVCDTCSKEQFEDKTEKWERIEIEGKLRDFCSKKCSSKFVKQIYMKKKDISEFPKYSEEDTMKKGIKKKRKAEEETEEEPEEETEEEPEEEMEDEAPEPKKKLKKKDGVWKVMDIPSQYQPAIVNQETEEILDINTAMARLLNEMEKIKKLIE